MKKVLISLLLLSLISFLPQNTHASNIMLSNNKKTEHLKKPYNPKRFELKEGQTMLDALIERREKAKKAKKERIPNKATKSQMDKRKKDTEKKIDRLNPRKTKIDDLSDLKHKNIGLEEGESK